LTLGAATSLERLQHWLVAVSTEPDGAARGVERASALYGTGTLAELENVVTPGPRLSALERLGIYNDGYFARLVECLRDDYPAIGHALGAETFEGIARDYIRTHPSRSPSLNAYGADFAAYLRTRSESWVPFAVELARLEWALVEVIHRETGAALASNALAEVPPDAWPRVRFVPKPALELLDVAYPVNAFYQAFRDELEPRAPAPAGSSLVVHRVGLVVYRLELEPVMRGLLGDLLAGKTLGAALAELERRLSPDELAGAQANLPAWFGAWVAAGFFTALELE
jgi:hypothetical protein